MAGEARHVAGGAIAPGPEPSVKGKEGRAPGPSFCPTCLRHGPRAAFAPAPSAAGCPGRSGQEGSPTAPEPPAATQGDITLPILKTRELSARKANTWLTEIMDGKELR